MADTLARQSPLQGFSSRFADLPESASVAEEPFEPPRSICGSTSQARAVSQPPGSSASTRCPPPRRRWSRAPTRQ